MDKLDTIRSMDFLEQIGVLADVEKHGASEAIPALFELYLRPTNDAAVDTMIRNCLRNLLLKHDEQTLAGLNSNEKKRRTFCLFVAGEKALAAAAPSLLLLAESCENDPDQLLDVLTAMSRIKAQVFLPVFRKHLGHTDDYVAGLCVGMAGAYQDHDAFPLLAAIVEANEADDRYEDCAITTWKAIEALAALQSPQALDFLVSKIHHRNPTARRCIHERLTAIGSAAVEFVAKELASTDIDDRIMAANVLGNIGDKKGADALIQVLDDSALKHPNLLFAAYEALGKIRSMKSLVALLDAFATETDLAILMAVAEGLNSQANPGIAAKLKELAHSEAGDLAVRVIQAVVGATALQLFEILYADPTLAPKLTAAIGATHDAERIKEFAAHLKTLSGKQAAADAARLLDLCSQGRGKQPQLLAIDDSKAMLNFYRTAGAQLGYEVSTAENGKEAFDLIDMGVAFDLVLVDMNMPVMDGIEFTTKVRCLENCQALPIIMATTESEKSQAQLAKKAGVTSFLKKPFTLEILHSKIKNVLG